MKALDVHWHNEAPLSLCIVALIVCDNTDQVLKTERHIHKPCTLFTNVIKIGHFDILWGAGITQWYNAGLRDE
jgi:hypothetical protein